MKSPPLVLASSSRYRRELLARLNIPFTCISPGIDEQARPLENGRALAVRLAREKAAKVAEGQPAEAMVIGSDQVALLIADDGTERVLGKPGTPLACTEQLLACSGHRVDFVTAVCVVQRRARVEFEDLTCVAFRNLDSGSIERYVAHDLPVDCAGGFKSESLGIALCESITSKDPTALLGLPMIQLCEVLRGAGVSIP